MSCLLLRGRSLELQKWRHLTVAVQKAFAFSTSTSTASAAADMSVRNGGKGQNFAVSYLVKSLGLPEKLAESISRKVSIEEKGNHDSVLNLFRSHGFTDSQISTIITNDPRLLILDADKSLGPKLQFLSSRGASTSELTEVLSKVPKILGKKGDITISRYYDFVKEVIEADKCSKFKKLCHSLPEGSKQENKLRNILVLRELGVPQKLLFSLLISNLQIVTGKERFEESLKKVVEMGFDPTTTKFVQALIVVYGLSSKTIEEQVEIYRRLGFAVEDVWEMFKKWPNCLKFSEKYFLSSMETFIGIGLTRDEFLLMVKRFPPCISYSSESLNKKIEFVVKQMNWPLKAVVSNPAVFGYNLEKRTVPRCYVIKALMSKGLLGTELPGVGSVLVCTDDVFLKRYVMKHDDKLVRELMSIFTRKQRH